MAMKKWAMVIMNAGYDPEKDMARLDLEQVETHILTVRNPDEAVALAKRLGEDKIRRMTELFMEYDQILEEALEETDDEE